MITLSQPSMVCNDYQVVEDGITCFRMAKTWTIPESATPQAVIAAIVFAAQSCPNGRLHNLVLHCHGNPARLKVGCGSFEHLNVSLFKHLEGKVGHIWLVSCSVASQAEHRPAWYRDQSRLPVIQQASRNAGMTTREYLYSRVSNPPFSRF